MEVELNPPDYCAVSWTHHYLSCHYNLDLNESVVHFSNEEHKSVKEDFNWTSILHQDIEIAGIKIKTEDLFYGLDSLSSVPLIKWYIL
jgi:hypothetical protein